MKIKLKNATIFTMNENFDVLENATVIVDGEKIVKVSKSNCDIDDYSDKEINFDGDILMPAFVNAHTHSAMTLMRGVADDLPLNEWLFNKIFPIETHLTKEDVYYGAMLAVMEYVRTGTATIGDMYFYPDAMIKVAQKSGLNCVSVGGATDFGGEHQSATEVQQSNFEKYNNIISNFKYVIGAHSEYITTPKLIQGLCDLSAKFKTPLYAHASETLKEVGDCTVRHKGLTPIMYFHKQGFFENGASLAHCVHIDKDDIAIMSQCGVNVVSNPASNLKLASGIAPVCSMQSAGINVCLGTDGAASNNALDMFREMFLTATLQKSEMRDASVMKTSEVLKMATINGAKALFFDNLGKIQEGFLANIIRVSVKASHFEPHKQYKSHLVYSANGSDVAMTMCRGKILYDEGKYFIGEDVCDIVSNARECAKRLLKSVK